MITGYPHKGAGLFEVACGVVEKRISRPVQSTIVSLGVFPAPRAENYLKKKVFGFNPQYQYIVIQFGATDAQCPIRASGESWEDDVVISAIHLRLSPSLCPDAEEREARRLAKRRFPVWLGSKWRVIGNCVRRSSRLIVWRRLRWRESRGSGVPWR
jgi:hypothetical protein